LDPGVTLTDNGDKSVKSGGRICDVDCDATRRGIGGEAGWSTVTHE